MELGWGKRIKDYDAVAGTVARNDCLVRIVKVPVKKNSGIWYNFP